MEFRFNLKNIFKNKISRIGNSLLPAGYAAPDRRTALEATAYVSEIINNIGQESARAQGLNHPVTTSDRLRNSDDQFVYLLTEENDKNGLVVGLIKVGKKSLYVFDKQGETRHCIAPCVLDFYIHESRQRGGLGKKLFEHMCSYEGVEPLAFAYDRPSEKLLAFLQKYYGLEKKIDQMNNFVIYEGFFEHQNNVEKNAHRTNMHITSSPNSNLFGPQFVAEDNPKYRSNSRQRNNNNAPNSQSSFIGRYGAPKPQSSLNQIIHNKATSVASEPMSDALEKLDLNGESSDKVEQDIDAVGQVAENEVQSPDGTHQSNVEIIVEPSSCAQSEFDENDGTVIEDNESNFDDNQSYMTDENNSQPQFILPTQKFSKRMTGKRNISNIIVGTDSNMEFDQIEDKGFGVVKINRPYARSTSHSIYSGDDNDSARTPDNSHTAEGFYDLKFYSHPLW